MERHPLITTRRLELRPFVITDAEEVAVLAGDYDIAANTLQIPYPYEEEKATDWIRSQTEAFERGEEMVFAIVQRADNVLVGAIGLMDIRREHETAKIGYWIGKPYRNRGYATEALSAVLDYAFSTAGFHRIYAYHMKKNSVSGKVMRRCGMKHEGCLRQHIRKWGRFEDIEIYGIIREDYNS